MTHTLYCCRENDPRTTEARIRAAFMVHGTPLPPNTMFRRAPGGKPYLTGAGDACYSVSHSGGYWLCACGSGSVGVDIQQIRPCRREEIAARFFHPEERIHLERFGYRDFFVLWAAKESYVKFTGSGIGGTFSRINIYAPIPGVMLAPFAITTEIVGCLCAAEIGSVNLVRA